MRSIWTASFLALIMLCGRLLSAQSTANCTYSRFAYPGTQTILTWASGLNKWGSIVGTAQTQSTGVLGYIRYADGSFKSYQVNGHPTQFYHRNDNGDTVEFYIDSNNRKRGLLLSDSNKQTTIIPNMTDLRPMDINDGGVISGATGQGGPIHVHGFWLSGSTWQIVDDPE